MSTQSLTAAELWHDVAAVRAQAPLVHNITNFVVMNFTANVLLALGASPVMAHAADEVEDMAGIAGALVLNIGTLQPDWIASMELALAVARRRGIPSVLDPVGAGATPYRNRAVSALLAGGPPSIIRGNASEIMSVAGLNAATRGVDSSVHADEAITAARGLADRIDGIVCVSGPNDHVVAPGGRWATLSNGHQWMTRVTGVGCSATAMIGAFAAVQPDPWRATVTAMAYLGVAGELAAVRTEMRGGGAGTYALELLDAIHLLDEAEFVSRLRIRAHG